MAKSDRPLGELTATEIVRGISAGDFGSGDAVRSCLERVDRREAEVGACGALSRKAGVLLGKTATTEFANLIS